MATIHGFEFPEDRYYQVDKHVWCQPAADGLVRVGLTPVAYQMLKYSLVAISVRPKVLGQEVPAGKSVAMVESLKYNGPLAAPFTGVVVRANDLLADDPDRALADPYGDGWIVAMRPVEGDAALAGLLTGDAALAAYRALLESQGLRAE